MADDKSPSREERRAKVRLEWAESLRVSDQEKAESLWALKVFRKVPREERHHAREGPNPHLEWHEVWADYAERWCQDAGVDYQRGDGLTWEQPAPSAKLPPQAFPDLDAIRCIVFGWVEGSGPEAVDEKVRRWRQEWRPLLRTLTPLWQPQGTPVLMGEARTNYVQALRRKRAEIEERLADWPDSPVALARLVAEFRPIQHALEALAGEEALDWLVWIATDNETRAINSLTWRVGTLAALLDDAEESLAGLGWKVTDDGRLKEAREGQRGRKPKYLSLTIQRLWRYLRPLYWATFGDATANPETLRKQIARLLEPYFAGDLGTERKGRIWRAINAEIQAHGLPERPIS